VLAFWFLIAATLGILVHELGHVFAARILGLGVLTVGIGFGPKVFALTDGLGTQWKLALIPLGGSCSFLNRAATPATEPRALLDLSPSKRAAIYAAGPFANLVFASSLLLVTYMDGTPVSTLAITNHQAVVLLVGGFSLLLGLFNLIPVPPLDGGRLALIAIEASFGRPISGRTERSIFAAGTIVLTTASLVFSAVVLGTLL
jgi:membrane-associated protease RseP (regulator of RpoE activity)